MNLKAFVSPMPVKPKETAFSLTCFFALSGQTMVIWWPFLARAYPMSTKAILTLLEDMGSQKRKWPQLAVCRIASHGSRPRILPLSET